MTDPKQLLRKADDLRPALLKQLGYVPEPVLAFCNEVRAALAEEPTEPAWPENERARQFEMWYREQPPYGNKGSQARAWAAGWSAAFLNPVGNPTPSGLISKEEAARVCERRAERRFEEHGQTEPDTNASYYSGSMADVYNAMDEEDEDCAAAIRALPDHNEPAAPASTTATKASGAQAVAGTQPDEVRQLVAKLRYMGRQYSAGQRARGGGQKKHYLEEAADLIERLAALQPQPVATDEMVNRFLRWRLPEDFNPDCGIRFEAVTGHSTPWETKHEPVGTNLFTAEQARKMLEFVLAASGEIYT